MAAYAVRDQAPVDSIAYGFNVLRGGELAVAFHQRLCSAGNGVCRRSAFDIKYVSGSKTSGYLPVVYPFLTVAYGEGTIGSETEDRRGIMGKVICGILHSHFLTQTEQRAYLVFQLYIVISEKLQHVKAQHRRTLVIHDTASDEPSFSLSHGEGISEPAVPCGNDIVKAAEAPTGEVLAAGGVEIIPIRGYHGQMPILGFRFGDIAYITDMSRIPDEEFSKLKGLKHLTLNTVSYHPHHSHFSLEEAVAMARRIGAGHTWLTHLSHTFPSHDQFDKELPDGISPAYDGLVITD